jgi:methane/ammonia monooxygenase subunit A
MVWLRRTTHYLFIVVVAVNSTLLTINAGDYIFYTDWAWTSFVVFSISQSTMLVVGAIYYMLFTGVPGTATYYATIMTIYTWVAKGAWFALGYPYDFIVVPVWIPSAMLLDLTYWATRRNFGWTFIAYLQHDQSVVSQRSTGDGIQVSKTYIAALYDANRAPGG